MMISRKKFESSMAVRFVESFELISNFYWRIGSVSGANCKELAQQADIDGFLVGGMKRKTENIRFQFLL